MTLPQIQESWPHIVNHLMETKETWEETSTIESFYEELAKGQAQLWTLLDERRIVHMVAMTRVIFYPRGKVLTIEWVRGHEAAVAAHFIDWIENFAKTMGCFRLEIVGRAGWTRLMRDFGYKEIYRVVGKTLDPTMRKDH